MRDFTIYICNLRMNEQFILEERKTASRAWWGFPGACRARDWPRAQNCPSIVPQTNRTTCENFFPFFFSRLPRVIYRTFHETKKIDK